MVINVFYNWIVIPFFVLFHHKALLGTLPHLFLMAYPEIQLRARMTESAPDFVPTEKKPQQAAKAIKGGPQSYCGLPICHLFNVHHS
ncbi:hypothetical protein [Paenibacillus silvae]|uniref:hypothetical protein n=1 Tax=Paenibacillus silvae TaxID=1325358 RepID=UPI0020042794|nr:hypothetical protein [Paenibacillus silvae]